MYLIFSKVCHFQVSMAAMVVFSYASLLPAGLFGYLWWAGAGTVGSTITFVELVCLYGYSLTIYIPVSLLWLVPVGFPNSLVIEVRFK